MPIIFAQALMFIPSTLTGLLSNTSSSASNFFSKFMDITSFGYNALFFYPDNAFYLFLYSYYL